LPPVEILPRHQTKPGRKLAPAAEAARLGNRRGDRRSDDRTDARDPPDGYARTETGEVIKIEVTGAQTPERELGTEYRCDESKKRKPKEYDPIEKVEDFAAALEDAIKKKVNDQNRGCALVVDLNIVNAIITPDEKEKEIARIKDKYAAAFKHLWILWNDKIF
jgi:hypothetical protein